VEAQLGDVDPLQKEVRRYPRQRLIEEIAIELNVVDLALPVQEVGIDLLLPEPDDELLNSEVSA